MAGVFISYRREDSAPYAGRLCDHLRRTFPAMPVFMDIDAIEPGEDFVRTIDTRLAASEVVLAVIGPRWVQAADGAGTRRLDDPDDYVVRELSAALEADIRVIPVLVGGARMPGPDQLPARLQPLARRHAIEVSDSRFGADVDRLGEAVAASVRSGTRISPAATPDDRSALADALAVMKTLLWTNYALALPLFAMSLPRQQESLAIATMIGLGIPAALLLAWLNVLLSRGSRRARIVYLALIVGCLPFIFIDWSQQSATERAGYLVSVAISFWVLRMMFTRPLAAHFLAMHRPLTSVDRAP